MIVKRKFKCNGCGKARPCFLEINTEKNEHLNYGVLESLKCVLDESNHTSYDWQEIYEGKKASDNNS